MEHLIEIEDKTAGHYILSNQFIIQGDMLMICLSDKDVLFYIELIYLNVNRDVD